MRERCRCWWIWSCLALAEVILGEETEWLIWRNGRNSNAEKVICWVSKIQTWLVVSNIFHFHPYLGKISNLTNMFQLGWNHQLETHTIHVCIFTYICLIWLANIRNQWMVCEEAGFIGGETTKQTDMQTNKHNQKIRSTKKAGKKQNREGNTTKKKTNTGK